MSTVSDLPTPRWPVERLRDHFGGIQARRIHRYPPPGTARKQDLIRWNERKEGSICELIDGCLVEKVMGFTESLLAGFMLTCINNYLAKNPLGVVVGEAGGMEILPGLVRVPDVGFVSWATIGADSIPEEAVPILAPDLAIEVISRGNTRAEMQRKVRDFFAGGSRQVWLVYPKRKTVDVYSSADKKTTVKDALDGSEILPGFVLSLDELFSASRRRSK